MLTQIIILTFFVTVSFNRAVNAAPTGSTDTSKYATVCEKDLSSQKLKYEPGKTYLYEFETHVVTKLRQISEDEEATRFDLKGTAVLIVEQNCSYVLMIRKVSLETSNGQKSAQIQSLENSFIRFGYQDGLVEQIISVSDSDSAWSVNIKRAIVSLFNNGPIASEFKNYTQLTVLENDISGSCVTKYEIVGDSTYTKTRDLNRCGYRDGGFLVSQGVLYELKNDYIHEKEYLSDTLVTSSQICQQDFIVGILQTANCTETHKLELFSTASSGASVVSKASIRFVGMETGSAPQIPSSTTRKALIYFDHENDARSDQDSTSAIVNILTELCDELNLTGGTAEVPSMFMDLQTAISLASFNSLTSIYRTLKTKTACDAKFGQAKRTKLFLDASAMAATSDSIRFLSDLSNTGELSERTERLFNFYMAFAQSPNEEALKVITTHLKDSNLKLVLGSSGLAHQFCQATENCGSNQHYRALVNVIANIADTNCQAAPTEESQQKSITALQALGNLDHLPEQAVSAINKCLTAGQDRIKIIALQAFRRDPCNEKLKITARKMLEDQKVGSDIRIHAYLALTQCVVAKDVESMSVVMLRGDESDQVRSFIATHRANILYSPNPTKTNSKHAFKTLKLGQTAAPYDPRKFSTNFETSSFDEDSNFGYSVDTNLIYSQNSYIPKTISGNISVLYVGKSYNVFEYGLNLADFDRWIESIFGFTQQNNWKPSEDSYKPGRTSSKAKNLVSFDQKNIQRLQNQVIITNPSNGNGIGDFYIRVLGTTITAKATTLEDIFEMKSAVSPKYLQQQLAKLMTTSGKIELTEPIPLFSDELRIPTISGFPVHYEIRSTAIASLEWNNELSRDWKRISSRFAPRSTVLTRARMVVGGNGRIIESGMQLEMKAYNSGEVGVEASLVPGEKPNSFSYETRVKLPNDKITFLDAKSEVFWIDKVDNGKPSRKKLNPTFPLTVNIDNQCSARIEQYLGLQLCANAQIPALSPDTEVMSPFLPFILGSTQISLKLEKTDPSLKEFLIKMDYGMKDQSDASFAMLIDTPASTVNRKIHINGHFGEAKAQMGKFEVEIETPWKNLQIKGDTKASSDAESQTILITYEGKDYKVIRKVNWKTETISKSKYTASKYSVITYNAHESSNDFDILKVELKNMCESVRAKRTVETSFDVQTNIPLISLDGKLSGTILSTSTRIESGNLDFQNEIQPQDPYFDQRYQLDSVKMTNLKATTSYGHLNINSVLSREDSLVDLNLKYGKSSPDEQSLVLYSKSIGQVKKDFSTEFKLVSSQISALTLDGKWSSSFKSEDSNKISVEINHGSEMGKSSISLDAQTSKLDGGTDTRIDLKIASPKRNIDIQLKMDGISSANKSTTQVDFKFGSLMVCFAKLELDKLNFGYDFKSKNDFNEKTFILESSYAQNTLKALVRIEPDAFFADLSGTFDKKTVDSVNLENIDITLNTSALAQSKLLTLSYGLESKEAYFGIQKARVGLKYGQDSLGRFFFQSIQHNQTLEMFITKLFKANLKIGTNRPNQVVFTTLFNAEWFPTSSKANAELTIYQKPEPKPDVEIYLKLDDGSATRFYEWKNIISYTEAVFDSRNDVNIHGTISKFGIIFNQRDEALRGKPSLQLSFESPKNNKKYKVLISTNSTYQFKPELIQLLCDVDMAVNVPNRNQIKVHYLVELRKERLNADSQRFKLAMNYEAVYQDDEHSDSKIGFNIDTTLNNRWRPIVLLEVTADTIQYKLNMDVMSNERQPLSLNYESNDLKNGTKLLGFQISSNHQSRPTYPKAPNQLTLSCSFVNAFTKSSGNAEFRYLYRFDMANRQRPPTFIEIQESGTASLNRNSETIEFKSNKTFKIGDNEIHILHENIWNDDSTALLFPNFEIYIQKNSFLSHKSRLQISNRRLSQVQLSVASLKSEFSIVDPSNAQLFISSQQSFSDFYYKDLKFRVGRTGKESRLITTTITGNADENKFKVTNIQSWTDLSNDFVLELNDDKKVHVSVNMNPKVETGLTVSAKVQWGPGESQKLTSSGAMKRVDSKLSISLVFEGPALFGKQWTLDITNERQSSAVEQFVFQAKSLEPQQSVKLTIDGVNKEDTIFKKCAMTYEIVSDGARTGRAYLGFFQSLHVDHDEILINFDFVDIKNDQFTANFSVQAQTGPVMWQLSIQNCQPNNINCDSLEVKLEMASVGSQIISMFQVVGERNGLKTGINVDKRNQLLEIWYSSKAQKQQYVRLMPFMDRDAKSSDLYYITSDITSPPDFIMKSGLEITLTERTIVLALVQATWENLQIEAGTYEVGMWLDKVRQPLNRIGFGFTTIGAEVKGGIHDDQGRNVILHFGHPQLWKDYQKNLRINTKYRYGTSTKAFDLQSEFDIFKRDEDVFTFQAQLNHKVLADGRMIFAIDIVGESKGQGFVFETHCSDIKQSRETKTANCLLKAKSPDSAERIFQLNYEFDSKKSYFSLERITQSNQKILYYKSPNEIAWASAKDPFDGTEKKFALSKVEMQLPGMKDYRIHEQAFNENPFGYSFRTYPSSTPAEFTEFWLGKLAASEYGIGFSRIENGRRRNIIQVSNPKHGSLLFTLKFDWDKETMKDVIEKFRTRLNSTTNSMSAYVTKNKLVDGQRFTKILTNMWTSLPNSEKVSEWNRNEFVEIGKEQEIPVELVNFAIISNSLQFFYPKNETEILNTNLKQGLGARIDAYGQFIQGVLDSVIQLLDKDVDSSHIYSQDMDNRYLNKIYESLKALSQIRETIIELESKQNLLKKVISMAKKVLLRKFLTFYKYNAADIRNMFPYPETDAFMKSLKIYIEKRIFGNDNDPSIRDDFAGKLHLVLEKVFQETLVVDVKNGIFQLSIPEITRTKFVRKLMKPNTGEALPPSLPVKFWIDLLTNRGETLPPIEGKGLILGSSYFQTFDRVTKRFAATCQYVLASDFVGNNFTVAIDLKVDGKGNPSRAIIFTNHKDTIVLTNDAEIFFNGVHVSTSPSKSKDVGQSFRVYKDPDWITVRGDMGVLIGCSLKMDVCVVRVSGYYFGKVRGIMGNLNNEGYDDYTIPSGKVVESTETFVKAWKLNTECTQRIINKYIYDVPNYVQMSETIPLE